MTEPSSLEFFKYQALGNDFVLIDCRRQRIRNPGALSRLLCRRRFGVGADGLILLLPDDEHDARMVFYNPDGSRASMCGNGIRCLAKHLSRENPGRCDFIINTDAGTRRVRVRSEKIEAFLGTPCFDPKSIPLVSESLNPLDLRLPDTGLPPAVCLSVGNPHCVFFFENLTEVQVDKWGKQVENHPFFPERTNVEFACLQGKNRISCRVWERGAGETQSCGSGAAATAVAAAVKGLVEEKVEILLPGGVIEVTWRPGEEVAVAGEAQLVFKGFL